MCCQTPCLVSEGANQSEFVFVHAYSNIGLEPNLVLRNICSGGHSDLNQKNLVSPFWVLLEKLLKRQELLGNAFDHVQPVYPQHDLQHLSSNAAMD